MCYGSNSPFVNTKYIKYYFNNFSSKYLNSYIALNNNNIVASYSFLKSYISILGKKFPMKWGVNAATLPEHRKKGLGKECFLKVKNTTGLFGVFGFTKQVGEFYSNESLNLFKSLANKYVLILNSEYMEFLSYWKQNHIRKNISNKFLSFNHYNQNSFEYKDKTINKIVFENINTSYRNEKYIDWKFNKFQSDGYERYKRKVKGKVSHIIVKRVRLMPTHYYAIKIVDIYGEIDGLKTIIDLLIKKCLERNDIYIDFCCIGNIYNQLLENYSFIQLNNEENNSFPELVAPLTLKKNQYRIAFYSSNYPDLVAKMNHKNSYFTRLDSDRERISDVV